MRSKAELQHAHSHQVLGPAQEAGEVCREVLTLSGLSGWQIGKTRAFLRAGQLAALEVRILLLCAPG